MGTENADGQAPPRFIPSSRFTLALLVFYAFIVQYSQRVNLPIAIVCMVNQTKTVQPTIQTDKKFLGFSTTAMPLKNVVTSPEKGGVFVEKQFYWEEFQQQILLGGYWAGYIFTQVPGRLTIRR